MDILTDLHSCVEKSEAEWDLNDYFLLEVPFGLLCASAKKTLSVLTFKCWRNDLRQKKKSESNNWDVQLTTRPKITHGTYDMLMSNSLTAQTRSFDWILILLSSDWISMKLALRNV